MEFLNPALLWGVLGVSVPILIHLLNRFRYREVRWAAMDLLRKALTVRSRRVRIEDLLLLALRCAAVSLVALALARPTISPRGALSGALGSSAGAVIALDGSFSMGHRPGLRSRFDGALERVAAVAGTLAPGAPVSLVLLGDRPRILLRNVGLDPARIEKAIEGLAPLPEGLDLEAALEEIDALVSEIRAADRECHLVTDAQAVAWSDISPRARETLRSIAGKARVHVLTVGAEGDENLAVAGLEHVSGSPRGGAVGRFRATVRNAGSGAREGVAVTLVAAGIPVDSRTIERIEPGATAEAALFAPFEREGSLAVTARVEGDPLPEDDERHLVVEVRARTSVVIVAADPATPLSGRSPSGPSAFAGPTGYLETALRAGWGDGRSGGGGWGGGHSGSGGWRDGEGGGGAVAVETIDAAELAARDISGADIVILADVPDVPPEAARALANFVRAGGALWVFLGGAVDPALLDARLRSPEADILPADILGVADGAANPAAAEDGGEPAGTRPFVEGYGEEAEVRTIGRGAAIDPGAGDHPLARALRALPPETIEEARVRRWFRLRLVEGARPVLRLAGRDDVLLAERELGLGRTLLWATSADASWHDLVVSPAYPILVQEAVRHLTRSANERPLVVGDPLVVALPPEMDGEEAILRDPAGTPSPVKVERAEGRRLVRLPAARLAGAYAVESAPREGDAGEGDAGEGDAGQGDAGQGALAEVGSSAEPAAGRRVLVAVNVDTRESDVRALDPPALARAIEGPRIRVIGEAEDLAAAVREARTGRELWRALVLASIAILVLESILGRRFARRDAGGGAP